MSLRNYLYTCVAISLITVVAILFVPGVAASLEAALLGFLAANATG
jgi:hypothetical protein